jgi:sugar lactone lactonase YvrE
MQEPTLFTKLPDFIATPDAMAIDEEGNLVLSCPNFADTDKPGCLARIDRQKNVTKWVDVPVHEETGRACPMGIAFGPDWDIYICDNQGWSNEPNLVFKGRMLRLRIRNGNVQKTTVVAYNMEHPNGVRVHGNHIYVTQSLLSKVKDPSGKMVSCVYRFGLDEENIEIGNTLADKHIITTFLTQNPVMQYGADGIEFDKAGNMYVGNFGDGAIHRITFSDDRSVKKNEVFARDLDQMISTDGMTVDGEGNLYVADFCANAIAKVTPAGKVTRIAQSPDTDGMNGELDQPAEAMIFMNRIVASCFDLVTEPAELMVNTGHEMPATMSQLEFV